MLHSLKLNIKFFHKRIINNTLLRTLVSYLWNCIILQDDEEEKRPLNPKPSQEYSGIAIPNGTQKEAARGEYYYMYEPIFSTKLDISMPYHIQWITFNYEKIFG